MTTTLLLLILCFLVAIFWLLLKVNGKNIFGEETANWIEFGLAATVYSVVVSLLVFYAYDSFYNKHSPFLYIFGAAVIALSLLYYLYTALVFIKNDGPSKYLRSLNKSERLTLVGIIAILFVTTIVWVYFLATSGGK